MLEDVCANALDEDGEIVPAVAAALVEVMTATTILVLDRIEFDQPEDDVPVLRGLLARGVLEHIGTVGAVVFLPSKDAALWMQAVGARRAGRFVVASCDLQLPPFPIGVVAAPE